MKQTEIILEHLTRYGSISQLEAMREYGIMRLASRISDIKKQGYTIIKTTDTALNRSGKAVHFARYAIDND